MLSLPPSVCHYYVDEAGDTTIFGQRNKVIIGQDGCSRFFILGALEIPDPETLSTQLNVLRGNLLSDPYFAKIPSMQLEAQKTALAFHAKDDLPEVRREVFALLKSHSDIRFFAVVKNKQEELNFTRVQQQADPKYRYHPNTVYDYMISRLFRGLLHKKDHYHITFAKRGNSERTQALQSALEMAKLKSKVKAQVVAQSLMQINTINASQHCGLQAVDYFLWALQRFCEKSEERYIEYLWPSIHLVRDLDDKRKSGAGKHYTQERPIYLGSPSE